MIAVGLAVTGVIVFGSGQLFRQTEDFVIYFDGSLAGLNPGAPVKYRGVQIGTVTDVLFQILGSQQDQADARLPVIVELDEERLLARGADVDLGDVQFMDSIIAEGLRAQIVTESFVTGLRYIELGEFPGTPIDLVSDPAVNLKEIPSITQEGLAEITADAQEFLENLAAVDLGGMMERITDAVEEMATAVTEIGDQVSDLAGSPTLHATVDSLPIVVAKLNDALTSFEELATLLDTTLAPRLGETLDQANSTLGVVQATFEDLQSLVAPGSPMTVDVQVAMRDLSNASRALRDLAEYLQRNPSSLIRGKPEGNE